MMLSAYTTVGVLKAREREKVEVMAERETTEHLLHLSVEEVRWS